MEKKKIETSTRGGRTAGRNADEQHVPRQLPLQQKRTLSLRSRAPATRSQCKGPMGLCACASGPLYRLTGREVGGTTGNPLSTYLLFFAGCLLYVCVSLMFAFTWMYLLRWQHLA